jgi:hypothetical protein
MQEGPKGIPVEMPHNFISIIKDFTADLSISFPEYQYLWDRYLNQGQCQDSSASESSYVFEELFSYCMKIYPERFFDILYQNDEMFLPESTINTMFLPNVEFKLFFTLDSVTDSIKQTIWKYLQLILMTIMTSVKNKSTFGDSANIFEGIDEEELQNKLNDTISGLGDFFKNMDDKNGQEGQETSEEPSETSDFAENFKKFFAGKTEGMPSADDLHSHIKGLFGGKIGVLAKELAEELSEEFMGMMNEDGDKTEVKSTQDIFKKIMRNPKKMIDLLKSISGKLNAKMKAGDISQEELMKEAGDLIGKMKEMGGGNFGEIMKNLTKNMGGLAGNKGKMDMNALNRMTSMSSQKERMKAKLDANRQKHQQLSAKKTDEFVLEQSATAPNNFVFSLADGEQQPKSSISKPIVDNDDWLNEPLNANSNPSGSSSKKKKSKKGKK